MHASGPGRDDFAVDIDTRNDGLRESVGSMQGQEHSSRSSVQDAVRTTIPQQARLNLGCGRSGLPSMHWLSRGREALPRLDRVLDC